MLLFPSYSFSCVLRSYSWFSPLFSCYFLPLSCYSILSFCFTFPVLSCPSSPLFPLLYLVIHSLFLFHFSSPFLSFIPSFVTLLIYPVLSFGFYLPFSCFSFAPCIVFHPLFCVFLPLSCFCFYPAFSSFSSPHLFCCSLTPCSELPTLSCNFLFFIPSPVTFYQCRVSLSSLLSFPLVYFQHRYSFSSPLILFLFLSPVSPCHCYSVPLLFHPLFLNPHVFFPFFCFSDCVTLPLHFNHLSFYPLLFSLFYTSNYFLSIFSCLLYSFIHITKTVPPFPSLLFLILLIYLQFSEIKS